MMRAFPTMLGDVPIMVRASRTMMRASPTMLGDVPSMMEKIPGGAAGA
jgi:hypothetical protein